MKPLADGFAVVTATTDLARRACRDSWEARATYRWPTYVVYNGGGSHTPYLGTVPAFAEGVARALKAGHSIIACLHDDLLIEEDGWDAKVLSTFHHHPEVGLVGFLGGTGLGDTDIYQKPYSPHQLARQGVVSNERNAETHGTRTTMRTPVAVLDGFSQIGRADFWRGKTRTGFKFEHAGGPGVPRPKNLYAEMAAWGLVHHAYDAALGCFAARLGWEVWMLPVACHHLGGQTAVGDPGYADWAKTIVPGGDQDFWSTAHAEVYERFRDVLPIRVPR